MYPRYLILLVLVGGCLMHNIAFRGDVAVTSAYDPPYSKKYVNDGVRGRQSLANYWNNAVQFATGETITLTFAEPAAVESVILQPPVMDISGPYVLSGISVKAFFGSATVVEKCCYSITAANEAGLVDAVIPLSNNGELPIVDKIQVVFAGGNVDGWTFLGEVQVISRVHDLRAAADWMKVEASKLIRAAATPMNNLMTAFPPQYGVYYNAFWMRDFAYMLQPKHNLFYPYELSDIITLLPKTLRGDAAAADAVGFDGTIYYKPGFGTMGDNPVLDGGAFYVDIIYNIWKKTAVPLEPYLESCRRALDYVLKDAATGLAWISPAAAWDRCPYGFTDQVRKTGHQLFDSLLLYQAYKQYAEMLTGHNTSAAAQYFDTAAAVKSSINNMFWDEAAGLYRAATIQCNQPDIWGSLFAVWLGVSNTTQTTAVANYMITNLGGIFKYGGVRHLPLGMYWSVTTAGPDTYQNGGYWPTAAGWLAYTVSKIDTVLGEKIIVETVREFQRTGTYEWRHAAAAGPNYYLASIVMPLAAAERIQQT